MNFKGCCDCKHYYSDLDRIRHISIITLEFITQKLKCVVLHEHELHNANMYQFATPMNTGDDFCCYTTTWSLWSDWLNDRLVELISTPMHKLLPILLTRLRIFNSSGFSDNTIFLNHMSATACYIHHLGNNIMRIMRKAYQTKDLNKLFSDLYNLQDKDIQDFEFSDNRYITYWLAILQFIINHVRKLDGRFSALLKSHATPLYRKILL